MRHFAVSAIGRDRPGIVAAVSEMLLKHRCNIEDSQMTILRGHFTMMLIVSAPDQADAKRLTADLEAAAKQLDLEAVSLSEVTDLDPSEEPSPSHIVSVYGADHPGIVHAVAAALAEHNVSITDLNTQLAGSDGGQSLYAMMLEVSLPQGVAIDEIDRVLQSVGRDQSVELTVRPLEQDIL